MQPFQGSAIINSVGYQCPETMTVAHGVFPVAGRLSQGGWYGLVLRARCAIVMGFYMGVTVTIGIYASLLGVV